VEERDRDEDRDPEHVDEVHQRLVEIHRGQENRGRRGREDRLWRTGCTGSSASAFMRQTDGRSASLRSEPSSLRPASIARLFPRYVVFSVPMFPLHGRVSMLRRVLCARLHSDARSPRFDLRPASGQLRSSHPCRPLHNTSVVCVCVCVCGRCSFSFRLVSISSSPLVAIRRSSSLARTPSVSPAAAAGRCVRTHARSLLVAHCVTHPRPHPSSSSPRCSLRSQRDGRPAQQFVRVDTHRPKRPEEEQTEHTQTSRQAQGD
jgi:hypothetical protein